MKKTILLFAAFLFVLSSIRAQTIQHQLVFVDHRGAVVKDGATLVLNKVEQNDFKEDVIHSGLSVRNTTGQSLPVMLSVKIAELIGGTLQVCFPSSCDRYTETNTFWKEKGDIAAHAAGNDPSLQTEFILDGNSRCKVTLQLFTAKRSGSSWVADQPQATVTLIFDKSTTAIRKTGAEGSAAYDIFTLQGKTVAKQLATLQQLAKGAYIVREKDRKGAVKTYKHLVK